MANDTLEDVFGPVIYRYMRAQAILDGVLVDVTTMAGEAGLKFPTAITAAAWADYVVVPAGLPHQDELGRLWDILWMLGWAIRSGRLTGEVGSFHVIIAKPDHGDWQPNETIHEGDRSQRLISLKAVCGPSDDGSPCLTIMRPEED